MPRTVPEIVEVVRHAMETIDASALSGVFAEDAVYELPFRSERVEGRDAILATLTAGGVRGRALGLEKTEVTVTLPESGFVLELVAVGRTFRFPSSVGIVTVADGEITAYRDYPNAAALEHDVKATAAKTAE